MYFNIWPFHLTKMYLLASLPWWCLLHRCWRNQSQTSSHIAEFPSVCTAGYLGIAGRCRSLLGAAGPNLGKLFASANILDSDSFSSEREKRSVNSHVVAITRCVYYECIPKKRCGSGTVYWLSQHTNIKSLLAWLKTQCSLCSIPTSY